MSKKNGTVENGSDPSPHEIRERAASIRRQWSKRVLERRRVWVAPTWFPPLILIGDMGSAEEN